VTLRARWVTLRARWVTLRARWVTLRARWVTLRARWVTRNAVALVAAAEGVPTAPRVVDALVTAAGGDLRAALALAQLWAPTCPGAAAPLAAAEGKQVRPQP
jgi:hypothetical protein